MAAIKIFNDPIYGLISFPFEILYELIAHPFFQRLRRISQMGLSSFVYPGAVHSRFNHALGVTHLSDALIRNLRLKGVQISQDEHLACCIAALLHDLGHGPFSHALEFEILNLHHEDLTLVMMEELNRQFQGKLSLAIKIFKKEYHRPFLSDLLSSQLDIDRMDYLNRDSFYTGVAEGIIGYQRIIKMMDVVDEQLVVEEKGIYSIEKFLISRYLMYNQVYLHRTALASEKMLLTFFRRYKELRRANSAAVQASPFDPFIRNDSDHVDDPLLEQYSSLDDNDIYCLFKSCAQSKDKVLAYLAMCLLNRRLFRSILQRTSFDPSFVQECKQAVCQKLDLSSEEADYLVLEGEERNIFYSKQQEIHIKVKSNNTPAEFSDLAHFGLLDDSEVIHFLTFPKEVEY